MDKQQTPMTGVTGDKASAQNDLEEKTLEIADQLSALFAKNGDQTMGASGIKTGPRRDGGAQHADGVPAAANKHRGASSGTKSIS